MVSASPVAMDRVQTGNGVPPAETDLSFLPCPREGIRNNATELIGFTPMVRPPMDAAASHNRLCVAWITACAQKQL